MEDEKGRNEGQNERSDKEEVFTKVVRAGKRTYFFDVKSTRHEDLYLTITESKKRQGKEGKMFYEKHKIFLYKEDFEKFTEGLREAVTFAGNGEGYRLTEPAVAEAEEAVTEVAADGFSDVDFDDLGSK
ncbi:MAG: PUR family DNA/RNA-binding protein [Bacteroidales bacterium]|nr:PUR family DNA/RNA-binding protein [Bacteroidales bacterium]